MGKAGEQDWAGDDARRNNARIARRQARLDLVEDRLLNDGWHGDFDDFVGGLGPAALRLALIEAPMASVDRVSQYLVDRRDAEARAKTRPLSARIESLRHLLNAHWPPSTLSLQVKAKDEPHGLGFDGIDDELFPGAMSPLLDLGQRIAKRQARPVIEALTGVLLHGAQDMLAVLAALIFVEKRDDLPHHHLSGIVAKFLCNGNESHIVLCEFANVHLQAERVAKEARERMNDNDIDRMVVVAGPLDHALKLWPVVVHG